MNIGKIGKLKIKDLLIELFVTPKTKEFLYQKGFSKKELNDYLIKEKRLKLFVEGLKFSSKKGKIIIYGATEGVPTENPERIEEKIYGKGIYSTTTIYKNPFQNAVIFFKIMGAKFR
ncbi:MAG: hypothetical protein QT10_C0001G0150 [archaeon GW2011_AR19]|nr:MAG: hypothetical protein QT10_C0001G0150 [archaeon GW2011_AR19]